MHTSALSVPADHVSQITVSNIGDVQFNPAPTINVQAATHYGHAYVDILPDSGICAAGPLLVRTLGKHLDNLAYSDITPRAVNGTTLHPIGNIPKVTFCLQGRKVKKDVHIYPSVSSVGTLHKLLAFYQRATQSHSTASTSAKLINHLPHPLRKSSW